MRSRGLLEIIQRRWPWFVAVLLVSLLSALAYSLSAPKTYRADAAVLFSPAFGDSAAALVQGSTYIQGQVVSFARLATTPAVLGPVIEELELDTQPEDLAERIEATAPLDTVFVEVVVTDTSPEGSARIADAVVSSLSRTVEDVAPKDAQGRPTVRAATVAPAETPREPASPDLWLNLGVGLVVGVALGMGAAYARQAMDSRVRDAEVLEDITSLPVIGTIANAPRMRTLPVVMQAEPRSPAAEAFRQLRTNLQFLAVPSHVPGGDSELRTVMVTSSLPGEGKSIVAVNLAAALAETSARVLLVDADLRRPSVAGLLGLEGAAGLTTVLLGRASVQDVVQDWGDAGLSVLTTGPLPPNPSEFLSAPAMDAIVRDLRYKYDYVVLDTTPVLPVADAAMLSHSVDGVVVVADVRRVRRHQLTEALHTLAQVNGRTLGVALNRVRHREQLYGARVEGRRRGEVPVRHLGPAAAQGRHSRASDRPQAALGSVDDERSMRQTVQPASQTGDPE